MRTSKKLLALLLLTYAGSVLWGAEPKVITGFGRIPLAFEPNLGQTDARASFVARGKNYSLALTPDGAVLSLRGSNPLRLTFVSPEPAGKATGEERQLGASNYFLGTDPAKWVINVPHFSKVRRPGVWEGIDAVYYGNQGKLEYDLVVHPNANPAAIRMRFEGHKRLRLDTNGDLVIEMPRGEVRQLAAVMYEGSEGRHSPVKGRYVLRSANEVGIMIDQYDKCQTLVIDPVLVYSTYLGGSAFDSANAIAVDSAGNAYIAGETQSGDFPKLNPMQGAAGGGSDVFVTKINPTGTALVYSTFLGGNADDRALGIAVDVAGNAYVGGRSASANFPLQNPLYSVGSDFLAKINAAGNALVYSTKFNTNSPDIGIAAVAVNSNGEAMIAGGAGANLPLVNPYQATYKASTGSMTNAFLAKLNAQGTALVFSTYLGGSGSDQARGISIDPQGNSWIAGSTSSTNFPTLGARQPGNAGGVDAFVSKFSAAGQLLFSTFLGGTDTDQAYAIATDASGNAFVTGSTNSVNFSLRSAYQTAPATSSNPFFFTEVFVAGYTPTGSDYLFSTYLGGHDLDYGYAIAALPDGSVAVVGETASSATTVNGTVFPTVNAIQAFSGNKYSGSSPDAFISRFSPAGGLLFSSFLGGNDFDSARGVAVDPGGNIYIAGQTKSNNFPAAATGLQANRAGNTDAFVAKIDMNQSCAYTLSPGPGIFPLTGGSGTIAITTASGCYWTAASNASWITVTSGTSGFGSGTINYQVAPNTDFLGVKAGAIAFSTGDAFVILQDGDTGTCKASPISPNTTITATLTTACGPRNPVVLYYTTLTAGQSITIDANSAAVYPYVQLYNPAGDAIGSDGFGPSCVGFPSCTCTHASQQAHFPGGPGSTSTYKIQRSGVYAVTLAGIGATVCANYFGDFTLRISTSAALGVSVSHSGTFLAGQQNASYSVVVANPPGADPTSGAVTVTETVPSGLTLVSMSGSGWTCSSNTCSRTGVLAAGASYPPISVNVNVSPNAASPQINSVSVSGGGSTTAVATDSTTISLGFSLSQTKLNFGVNGATITSPQNISVDFGNRPPSSWIAQSSQPNIIVSSGSGIGNGSFQVTARAGASGIVTVTSSGAVGAAQQVQVSLVDVSSSGASSPIGSFDTPANNATGISGAIAVTGWALSPVEVTGVQIWRDPIAGETPAANGLAFVGNAVFIAGARPDVQAQYPNLPFNYRGGWGYLLLTTGLPGVPTAQNTFRLHAIARDASGQSTELGTKTITVDNGSSSKPFGTVDTPDQGGTASGTQFINFGWALAQNPFCIPKDGSTLSVVVDGVVLGHPVYNQFRADLASAFPNRCNTSGAAGLFVIDTTRFTNGVHTISWLAFDDHGNGDGLGSRFFNVFNATGSAAEPAEAIQPVAQGRPSLRRGFDPKRAVEHLSPESDGAFHVDVEELDRIALDLGAISGFTGDAEHWQPLPVGSTLKGGTFYWQLGPGFHSTYALSFERQDGSRVRVRVRVAQKAYSAPSGNE